MKIYVYKGQTNLIGERVKKRRKELKLSQKDLAARLQVEEVMIDHDAIGNIERGNRFVPDYEVLNFAKVLKVDVMWLLTGEEPTR